jgi:hypothetical protein
VRANGRQNAFALVAILAIAAGARVEDPLPLVKPKSDAVTTTAATSATETAPASELRSTLKTKPAGKERGKETNVPRTASAPAVATPAISTIPPPESAPPHNDIAEAQPPDPDTAPDPSPPPSQQQPAAATDAKPPSQAHVFILIAALVVLGTMTVRAGRG